MNGQTVLLYCKKNSKLQNFVLVDTHGFWLKIVLLDGNFFPSNLYIYQLNKSRLTPNKLLSPCFFCKHCKCMGLCCYCFLFLPIRPKVVSLDIAFFFFWMVFCWLVPLYCWMVKLYFWMGTYFWDGLLEDWVVMLNITNVFGLYTVLLICNTALFHWVNIFLKA